MLPLDPDTCFRAMKSRDARFDGRFYATVKTTGIYCRPICPAPNPKRKNVDFVPTAAAAEALGFRACLRCRPGAAPGSPDWRGSSALLSRALRRIHDGALNRGTLDDLSAQLDISSRHLARLFVEQLGATPTEFARTLRAHDAWRLLEQTKLTMTEVAFASGYGSLRSFNAEVQARFGRSPREVRKLAAPSAAASNRRLRMRLSYRPPLNWKTTLDYLRARAIPGVEYVDGECYRRTVLQEGQQGQVEVRQDSDGDALIFATDLPVSRGMPGLIDRVRTLFDLRADPEGVARDLGKARELKPMIAKHPGLRLMGAWDGFELALRAILGQQVSLKGARTLWSRIAKLCGERAQFDHPELSVIFPSPEQVLAAKPADFGCPKSRQGAILALAHAVVDGGLDLDPGADPVEARAKLLELPGVGPWTADYILMRGLQDPDAFPAGDLVLRKVLSRDGSPLSTRELEARSEAWRPWRGYAAMWLWNSTHDPS